MAHKLPAIILLGTLAVLLSFAAPPLVHVVAGDPDMLQDICVADYHSLKGRKSSLHSLLRTARFTKTTFYVGLCNDSGRIRMTRTQFDYDEHI